LQPALLATLYVEKCPEKDRYVELIQSGNFYEFCNDLLSSPADFSKPGVRDKFKRRVFAYTLYNRNVVQSELRTAFTKHFPNLCSKIERVKRCHHSILPIRMMSLESSIVIDEVMIDLADHFPTAKFISVHDAVACTEDTLPQVETVMKRRFAAALGFVIPAKVKELGASGTRLRKA
jgi:hypothetical protein